MSEWEKIVNYKVLFDKLKTSTENLIKLILSGVLNLLYQTTRKQHTTPNSPVNDVIVVTEAVLHVLDGSEAVLGGLLPFLAAKK